MSQSNIEYFNSLLLAANWNSVIDITDTETAFSNFFKIIKDCFEQAFPLKVSKSNKQFIPLHPWMSHGLLTSRKAKIKLFRKKLNRIQYQQI